MTLNLAALRALCSAATPKGQSEARLRMRDVVRHVVAESLDVFCGVSRCPSRGADMMALL